VALHFTLDKLNLMKPISVLLFDDNVKFRESICAFIENSAADICVKESFSNAINAGKLFAKYQPDVVLMNIEMPLSNGMDGLIDIKTRFPEAKIMMLSSSEDNHRIFVALCNGALGYVLKDSPLEDILEGIRAIFQGNVFLSPSISQKVFKMMENPVLFASPIYTSLTPREHETLRYLAEGFTRKQIATTMGIQVGTVSDYTKAIYKKMHVNSALEAVREGLARRLIEL
jgi:DNA-binding NarL/FixJ family response regulator